MFIMVNNYQQSSLGEAIHQRRRSLRITQSLLADISGVGRHTITDIESGQGNPTLAVAQKLLSALGLKFVIEVSTPPEAQSKECS